MLANCGESPCQMDLQCDSLAGFVTQSRKFHQMETVLHFSGRSRVAHPNWH